MSSSSYSRRAKNDSDGSNPPSVKSVDIDSLPKPKKKKVIKKKYKEIYQPPLHFDFNLISSPSSPKEILSLSEIETSPQKAKSVYNSSVTSKINDNVSNFSTKTRSVINSNNSSNVVRLPPPSKPNFIRRNQDTIVKASFEDRWQLYLEMKTMDQARNHIYFKVYFYKWKDASTTKFLNRIREKTARFESISESDHKVKSNEKDKNLNTDDAVDLIKKARKKYNEYTSFLSEFDNHVSNYIRIPKQSNNDANDDDSIETSISKIKYIKAMNNQNYSNSNANEYIMKNANSNTTQNYNINNNSSQKTYIFNQNENEEDNFSSFFNDDDNNSYLVAKKLINQTNRKTNNSSQRMKSQQESHLCEFDFTDYSDNLLQIETPQPSSSFTEPKPPSENSDSGEMPKSEVQISMDSITVANSFCDMIDNSINRSKELAIKTKTILAGDEQSSSDIENEFQDHSFINEKKRRYVSSSSSDDDENFLPKIMIRYSKDHDSYGSLADSFHMSRSSKNSHIKDKKYSFGFPSDLYDEILTPLPVQKVKIVPRKR